MPVPDVDPQLLSHIKTLIRRDLKLGPDVAIADDMPFFGNDVDLDSLDMLLLVTSIEKEFGIKVPSEAVGRDVFQSVATLARYIQSNRKPAAAGATASTPAAPSAADPLARLPHADPFRFVTRLTDHQPGVSATGVWSVRGDEPFFAGHFPGRPIVPGVLLAEALAQLSGIAGPATSSNEGKLVHVDVRFDASVTPPADITLRSTLTRVIGPLQQFDVSASLSETPVARGTLTLHRPQDEK